MLQQTGCAGVAIGRGAMLDPWIFRRLQQRLQAGSTGEVAENRDHVAQDPSAEEQLDFLVSHFHLMTQQHGDYSCRMFRKFAAWYGARLGIPEDLEARLRQFESPAEFDQIVEQIRARHGERVSRIATALVKVPNGPVEHW
jgi:tRNA-dihydrouridine synthase